MKTLAISITLGILCFCITTSQSLADRMEVNHGSLGGYRPADIQSERVVDAANFAFASALEGGILVSTFSFESESTNPDDFELRVIDASQQVVAGINYKITVGVFQSDHCVGGFKVLVYNHFGALSVESFDEILTSNQIRQMIGDSMEKGT